MYTKKLPLLKAIVQLKPTCVPNDIQEFKLSSLRKHEECSYIR